MSDLRTKTIRLAAALPSGSARTALLHLCVAAKVSPDDEALAEQAQDIATAYTRWVEGRGEMLAGKASRKVQNLRSLAIRLRGGKGDDGDRKEARRAVQELRDEMGT